MKILDQNERELSIEVLEVKNYKGIEIEIDDSDNDKKMKVYISLNDAALLVENIKGAMHNLVKLF